MFDQYAQYEPPAFVGAVSVEDSFYDEVVLLLSAAVSRVLLSKVAAPTPSGWFCWRNNEDAIHE